MYVWIYGCLHPLHYILILPFNYDGESQMVKQTIIGDFFLDISTFTIDNPPPPPFRRHNYYYFWVSRIYIHSHSQKKL